MKSKFSYSFVGLEGEIYKVVSSIELPKPIQRLAKVSVNISM